MQRTSRWLKTGVAVAALAVAAGCATMPGGVAPSNIPLDGKEYTQLGLTSGKDSLIRLFCIVPISGSNSIRSAMNRAVRNGGGDALINVTVEQYSTYWILFSRHVTKVEGVAVRLKN